MGFVGLCIGTRVLSANRHSSVRSRVAHGR
jgi:hypothetical protein